MTWSVALAFFSMLIFETNAINRPVYKIVLTQKGFTQFLQYDVETPPLREFTFCTWIRVYNLDSDQSIFNYVANGNNHIISLWLDSGGRYIKVSINGRVTSSAPVDIIKDVWRHVCLSYQSDYGAWALYMDAKLVSCEVSRSLSGFVIPRGGSLIIGYGTSDSGISRGLEGEIFGANMILSSTIERNYTTKLNHLYDQKAFNKNKIKGDDKNIKYLILSDLQTDEIHNNFEKAQVPRPSHTTKKPQSFIKFRTPHSIIEHDVGLDVEPRKPRLLDTSNEREIMDFTITDHMRTTSEKNKINFWNLVNKAGHEGKFKVQKIKSVPVIFGSSTQDLAMISEYETPPPVPMNNINFDKNFEKEIRPAHQPISHVNNDPSGFNTHMQDSKNKITDILPDVETPPPPVKDTKIYGQWTSSKFAGSVLNYLKSINFNQREKKTPSTIPLTKISDNYPYSSDFKITKLRPPVQFQRRNFNNHKLKLKKRGITDQPQINVQIVEDDLRSTILKYHAETKPKNVEVTNRGESENVVNNRFYRNAYSPISVESSESAEASYKPRSFKISSAKNKKSKLSSDYDSYKNQNLMTILPFLKSLEYFVADSQNTESKNEVHSSDNVHSKTISAMYSKSLSDGNKWHNVKSYSNDYTPRRINVDPEEGTSEIDAKIAEANKKHPSIRLKYKHESNKLVKTNDDPAIVKGRQLAMSVSNQANSNKESISIVKFNHGFLPSHNDKLKTSEKVKSFTKTNHKHKANHKNNFNKNVKLGNALNERDVIGLNEEQKKQSFLGGDEKIPDINRYRSDLDNDNENLNVPSSLGPRVCRTVEISERILYIQPDQSIDTSHIMSPVKKRNIGVEFIQQNYKKCSLDGSEFEKSYLLFIDWSKTPVRLFGGAYPKTTTDLCGFFK